MWTSRFWTAAATAAERLCSSCVSRRTWARRRPDEEVDEAISIAEVGVDRQGNQEEFVKMKSVPQLTAAADDLVAQAVKANEAAEEFRDSIPTAVEELVEQIRAWQLQLPAAERSLRDCEAVLDGLKLDDAEVVTAEACKAKFAAELARDEIPLAVEVGRADHRLVAAAPGC